MTLRVRSEAGPLEGADVRGAAARALTNARGEAVLQLPAGMQEITVRLVGYTPARLAIMVRSRADTAITLVLEERTSELEAIVVTVTRTGQRIQDEPIRVEVIDHEEVEEATTMVPGEVAHLIGETGGIRIQVTSPALGAANVRIQGLRGRYTQILADGLPLYGGQTGAVGLLQIPPADLGQVEVIKGVASALYGASALGGVINLVSRRPEEQMGYELLANRTTREGMDAVFYSSGPLRRRWGYSVLGGLHGQGRSDLDRDGWADLPGYRRGVVRPRLLWENGTGSSLLLTVGGMAEERDGGTMSGRILPDGSAFRQELTTRRVDAGAIGRFLMGGSRLLNVRGSAMGQRHRHGLGDVTERDFHGTWFGEGSLTAASGAHTWVVGAALQRDVYRAYDLSGFDYTYTVPSFFAQDEYAPAQWLTLAASGRLDFHSRYGTFLSPRISALLRPGAWTARASVGTGYFAPTPFTEETEGTGLSRLLPLAGLDAERARSASLDVGRQIGPLELNATVFGSVIRDAVMLRESAAQPGRLEIVNAAGPTRTTGTEFLARYHLGSFTVTAAHVFVRSTEVAPATGRRRDVALTPRYTAGLVVMWEHQERGRVGVEAFYTGRQRLDDNPYRTESQPYPFLGVLAQWKVGPASVFVNAENVTNVRQTRYDPLVLPQRAPDGRWTVDAWAPLEGRVINAGIRMQFGGAEEHHE